ncbi:gibberellin-regulated protein 12-like [Ziziphus jujuba]|uniref:Gibberellin-regulated protein 12-like n=1 Tax=Ziziphus jujuba TaxID=326968 RepID=A0A6P6GCN5_ZIZJJ|nr:gibberellin-regulated protein 12-like [Ziziphus jujuba]
MAMFSKVLALSAFFLIFALAFSVDGFDIEGQTSDANYYPAGGEGSLRPQDCGKACEIRCSATSHKKPCLFFCNKCCAKCLCVPSGTYGHKEECPCYNNWKTKEGGPKCP